MMTALNLPTPGSAMGQYSNYMNEHAQVNTDIHAGDKFNPSINKMNDTKMRSFETSNDIASTLYELWQFIPKNNGDGGKSWASPKRKFIPSDQGTLEDLVKSMAREESVEDQYQSLSKRRKTLIDELIMEHNQRDPRFEWTCVYINTERYKLRAPLFGVQDISVKIEVVIVRKLRPRAMPAATAFKNNAAGHANPQSPGNSNGFMGNKGMFESMDRKTASPQITGNNPGQLKDPGFANLQSHAGMPPTHPQVHPPMHLQGQSQGQSQGHLPMYFPGQPPAQPSVQQPVNPQGHPQGNPQGNPPAQFPAHRQVNPQVQHAMPPDSKSNRPIVESSGNYPTGSYQGVKPASKMDQNVQQMPRQATMGPQIGNNISQMAGPFAGKFNNEPRLPSQKAPAPTNMNNTHGNSVHREPSTKSLPPNHVRKNMASVLPPKVIQQDRQPLYARRAAYDQEDSSSRTEDDESLLGDDGYTSSASSVDSASFAKGSLHWQRKYPGQTMSDQGYRIHDRKQGSKERSRTAYPASTVDIFPSESNLRKRENKRVEDLARYSHPVTVHGAKHGLQVPAPSEFGLNSREASLSLFKIQEQQRVMMDKLNRLELQSQHNDSLDYVGNEVAVRAIEPEMPMPGRRFLPHEPQPFYRRRFNYVPREAMPYIYDAYY